MLKDGRTVHTDTAFQDDCTFHTDTVLTQFPSVSQLTTPLSSGPCMIDSLSNIMIKLNINYTSTNSKVSDEIY